MATINVNRQGRIVGLANTNFSTARTSDSGTATDGVSGDQSVQYFIGRGKKRFARVFLHFDTSGITGTLSAANINVTGGGSSPDPNDTIIIKSTAFGGDGGTALATSDMYSSLDYSTVYSTSLTTWSTSGNNEYTLTAAALADIKNNDHFTLAIIDHDNDYANTDTATVSDVTIDFDTTITLDYTVVSGYTHDVSSVAAASIGKVNTVATASIGKINSVD
jgi:microcystin-dependent protein